MGDSSQNHVTRISHRDREGDVVIAIIIIEPGLFLDIPAKTPIFAESRDEPALAVLQNEHFNPPCAVSIDFIGQVETMRALQEGFEPERSASLVGKQKRFVLYGIGGSGNTQLSAKYAQDSRK